MHRTIVNHHPIYNEDGVVGMSDLLTLLSYFGDFDLDSDGIWDSVDDCVGDYDECGFAMAGAFQKDILHVMNFMELVQEQLSRTAMASITTLCRQVDNAGLRII